MCRAFLCMSMSLDGFIAAPIFVPTDCPPDAPPRGAVRFVTDGIVSCVAQAKAATGDRDVMVHGAYTARECLRAGVLDALDRDPVELDLVRTMTSPNALFLRYEVVRP